jgi:glutamate carboxypeptidase
MSLTAVEQRLCEQIARRRADLLADLRLHVGLPTGLNNSPALDETRERLTRRLEVLGAQTELIPGEPKPAWLLGGDGRGPVPPTAVCRRTEGACAERVLIAGHLDTVHDPAGPFRELTVRADGVTAVGPGCVDMKGGLVIAVAALEALAEIGVPCSWSFFLNSDEETGTYHSGRTLEAVSREHTVGIALEPALPGGALAIERLGSGQFMIETKGRAAHVGREFGRGVSAVTKLAECIVAIGGMPDLSRGRIVNIGPVRGGAATNAVPDSAAAWGNARFPDGAVADELGTMLDALQTSPDAMPAVIVRRSFQRPAKPRTPAVERLALAARAAAEDCGQSLPFASTGGVCDGNIMQAAGLPTIDTMGVRGGGLHTPEEWIELPSLVERCQLLAVLLSRLAGGGVEAAAGRAGADRIGRTTASGTTEHA